MPDHRSPDPASAGVPDPSLADPSHPDPSYTVARELLGVLPFGARPPALAGCPTLVAQVGPPAPRARCADGAPLGGAGAAGETGERVAAAVLDAVESLHHAVDLPGRACDPLPPALVRRMLHVVLGTRDVGWPGTDAPLSVRRVAAADLFFDATQVVLADDDWKGPNGVEFALLTALARRICRNAPRPAAGPDEGRAREAGGERLGHLHRVQRPRRL